MEDSSKVPFQYPPKLIRNEPNGDSVDAGLSELGQMARQAFEEKRRKQSLALTNAILKIDPDNKEALVLQSWLRSDLQKELDTATQTIREAQAEKHAEKYDRAERLLRSILSVDAENKKASALLVQVTSEKSALATLPLPENKFARVEVPVPAVPPPKANHSRRWAGLVVVALLVLTGYGWFMLRAGDGSLPARRDDTTGVSSKAAPVRDSSTGSLELFVLPVSGVKLSIDDSPAQQVSRTIELSSGTHQLLFTADGYVPETISQTVEAGKRQIVPVVMKRVESANTADKPSNTKSQPETSKPRPETKTVPPAAGGRTTPRDPKANERPQELPAMGTLAVNAVAPIDVYFRGNRVGTTPITFQLPPGQQTIQYRFQGLQKTTSYVIRMNETTRAMVVFEADLQINANPWAQVSIGGAQGTILGQTPLNVRVPVGAVLLFTNPGFPEKQYVVTGQERTVQIVFP